MNGQRRGKCTKEREKRGRERAGRALGRDSKSLSVSWETAGRPQSPHWVCVGDDVSVKYKSEDRYENIADLGACTQYV